MFLKGFNLILIIILIVSTFKCDNYKETNREKIEIYIECDTIYRYSNIGVPIFSFNFESKKNANDTLYLGSVLTPYDNGLIVIYFQYTKKYIILESYLNTNKYIINKGSKYNIKLEGNFQHDWSKRNVDNTIKLFYIPFVKSKEFNRSKFDNYQKIRINLKNTVIAEKISDNSLPFRKLK